MGRRRHPEVRVGMPQARGGSARDTRAAKWIAEHAWRGGSPKASADDAPKNVDLQLLGRSSESGADVCTIVRHAKPTYLLHPDARPIRRFMFNDPTLRLLGRRQAKDALGKLGADVLATRVGVLVDEWQSEFLFGFGPPQPLRLGGVDFVAMSPDNDTRERLALDVERVASFLRVVPQMPSLIIGRFPGESILSDALSFAGEYLVGTSVVLGPARLDSSSLS